MITERAWDKSPQAIYFKDDFDTELDESEAP